MTIISPDDLSAWSGGVWSGVPRPVRGVNHDTRKLRPDCLYVALRGAIYDGHDFVVQAFQKGAAAAMVEASWRAPEGCGPLLRVADTRHALQAIAAGHRRRLRGRIIGVTGSVGKTTVKDLIATLLESAGAVVCTRGNWNNDIGLPLSLLEMTPEHAFGVFELGMNHPGEIAPLAALLRPDWVVMTRIGPVHIEFFPSEQAIAEEKAELLRALSPDGMAVLAVDEPWFDLLCARTPCRIVTVGRTAPADYTVLPTSQSPARLLVRERDGRIAEYRLPQGSDPMRVNALRAIAVAREARIAPEKIADALIRFCPAPMRWEEIRIRGVLWINDAYNANPLSMRAALQTFEKMPGVRRRWLVLGGMCELGIHEDAEHKSLGWDIAAGDWAGLVTVGTLGAKIAEAAAAAGWPSDRLTPCADARTAADVLRRHLVAGDAVLLKGSRSERIEEVLSEWRRMETPTASESEGDGARAE